jgi:hypothetical protein
MKRIISTFHCLAVLPLMIMLLSNLAPKGTDPRGYGPAFAILMTSFCVSGVFALAGLALLVIAMKMHFRTALTLISLVVSFLPLAFVIF